MRRVVTGVGVDGRSTVFSDEHAPVAFAPRPDGAGAFGLTRIEGGTVEPGARSSSVDVPAGETRWIITQMGPGLAAAMHSTPTVDDGVVVAGDVELGLEAGSVHLDAGDSVVVNGVEHSWLAGPNGCVIATVMVGLRESER